MKTALSLRHLRVFVTVAEAGSFVEAARVLHLTGAALSVVVRSLEEDCGFRVFDRTTRAISLTSEGASLLPLAHRMLSDHQAMAQSVENIRLRKTGRVRVATTQLLSCTLLPPALTRFRSRWPGIEVNQLPALYDNFQQLLQRQEVDLGIGPERLCDAHISATPLFESRLHVICSTSHHFAKRRSVRWSDLQDENVFLVDKRGASWLARDSNHRLSFERTVDVGHFSTALALASENEGVLFGPGFTRPLLLPYQLAMIPLTEPQAMRKFMMFRNEQVVETAAAKHLATHLTKAYRTVT